MSTKTILVNTASPDKARSKVLIIYTGGTFGMAHDKDGVLIPFDFGLILEHLPTLRTMSLELTVVSFEHPIDSSNINPEHWQLLAQIISDHYNTHDGFVILHGTDTMSYTASALSFMLEGLAKHNGPVSMINWALAELDAAYPLQLAEWGSLESQVAALADDIAYDNHVIDDGLRAGFLQLEELLELDFVADHWRAIERKFPGAPQDRRLRELVRSQIGWMVNDVIGETAVRARGMASAADVRAAGRATAAFSSGLAEQERQLKAFMYQRLYHHPQQLATAERARAVTAELYAAYAQEPGLMDGAWAARIPAAEPARSRHIADYIAGMTDRFAISAYARIYGRTPEGLSNV